MCQKFTLEQLDSMDHETKNDVIFQMQERLDKLKRDYFLDIVPLWGTPRN